MTALKIAQNIARGVGIVPPSNLVNNNNQDALRLLQAINDAQGVTTDLAAAQWVLIAVQHFRGAALVGGTT